VTTLELDKTYAAGVRTHGTIQIRVVVVKPKKKDEPTPSADEQEPIEEGSSPLSSYLERSAHGKQCVVFIINGQRHDALDSNFIARELGFKYLRLRTMIIVDLDGLTHEAISEIVQGSRQGLYEGDVFGAIRARMIATLKGDPDLTRLQTEAEQQISELQAGDEVVRQKLDQLIEAHHSAGSHQNAGAGEAGLKAGEEQGFGPEKRQRVVMEATPDVGAAGTPPVLTIDPDVSRIRLRSGIERSLVIAASPNGHWSRLDGIQVRVQPAIEELSVNEKRGAESLELRMSFAEPAGFDQDEYPLVTSLQVVGRFKGFDDARVIEREIVISRKPGLPPPPPPPPVLRQNPTFLRVVSRQPVKLAAGGASTHVRLRWDGDDSLTSGSAPSWSLRARCLSMGTFPSIGFSQPKDGRFELLLDTPHGLIPNQQLDFEVEAAGPAGQRLVATFSGQVIETPPAPEPRRTAARVPETASQRRPPYELKVVHESEWDTGTCWGTQAWTKNDVAAFTEPTDSTPLTLIINADAEELKVYRESLLKRSLDEATIQERMTRYTAHVAFHLYQMYRFRKERQEAQSADEALRVPGEDEMRLEIARVATTLIRLMEVSR
jgi:hypothetical protein